MRLGPRASLRRQAGLAIAVAGSAILAAACAAPPATSPRVPLAHPQGTGTTLAHASRPAPATSSPAGPKPPSTVAAPSGSRARSFTAATAGQRHVRHAKARPWAPSNPQPTISQAAYALVEAWSAHDRSLALADATPAAVAALFSHPYPPGGPQFRGCSTPPANEPAACVYRAGNDLLSLTVRLFKGGYAVTSAILES
jgi:hypothetical protein